MKVRSDGGNGGARFFPSLPAAVQWLDSTVLARGWSDESRYAPGLYTGSREERPRRGGWKAPISPATKSDRTSGRGKVE